MHVARNLESKEAVSEQEIQLPQSLPKMGVHNQVVNASPQIAQLQAYQNIAHATMVQRQVAPQNGLPTQLQSGIESLSGIAMNDVRVHYNSAKPTQLQAHAYAQGTDIHLSLGQEKHLPHEAWHVVQQKQGRVKPTLQLKGIAINDDSSLEREADVMGARAMGVGSQRGVLEEPHLRFESQRMLQRVAIGNAGGSQAEVAQLMTLKIMNIGDPDELKDEKDPEVIRRVGVLNTDHPVLKEAYLDDEKKIIPVSDSKLSALKLAKNLQADGNEILVINAHGSNGRVAGRTPQEFVSLLNDIGATGYREIHLYACQSGMAIFDFDRDISRMLNCKVWAPRGNTAFSSKLGRYLVRRMTYSGEQRKFVQDGENVWGENEGWWCLQNGRVIALGTPQTPKPFPKDISEEELAQWEISVDDSGSAIS